ncbi:hypothetical protein PYCC9005_002615 [Savitreella phatthalungensis]
MTKKPKNLQFGSQSLVLNKNLGIFIGTSTFQPRKTSYRSASSTGNDESSTGIDDPARQLAKKRRLAIARKASRRKRLSAMLVRDLEHST